MSLKQKDQIIVVMKYNCCCKI